MQFDYFQQIATMATLDIDDVGNCAIEAYNDRGELRVLIISTVMGQTQIMEYGPILVDLEAITKDVNCSLNFFQYSLGKIKKRIQKFLDNTYAAITQALVVDKQEALEKCISIIDYMKNN